MCESETSLGSTFKLQHVLAGYKVANEKPRTRPALDVRRLVGYKLEP